MICTKLKHKKLISIITLFTLALSGCGSTQNKTEAENVSEELQDTESNELNALEFTKLMGNGINLGNTMEAYGHLDPGTGKDISVYETLWGQPVTTQEMISGMKKTGFSSIRIPIAWTNAMNYESGDYTIDDSYFKRIDELIAYAHNEDMYVIINEHWDGSWWGKFGSAIEDTREEAMNMYVQMWTQIAEHYKDYPDYLIFESANEELGDRLNDIDVCADSGSLSEDECYETANKINQTFVETVRATGGNNAYRFLLIAGYNTDIVHTCDNRFIMPDDSAKNKLMVSVHYYNPWNYCGSTSTDHWGTQHDYTDQNTLFEKLSKFTNNGYGVIIGEYGVLPKDDGSIKNNICEYTTNLLNNCDYYNYCPMLWDCSYFYKRSELTFADSELEKLYLSRSYEEQSKLTDNEIKNTAKLALDAALEAAPEKFDEDIDLDSLDGATAWLMFNSNDWSIGYSAGDTYNPNDKTDGIIASDAEITGEGEYTVSLDFTGTNSGFANQIAFSAIGISNGELLYPDYVIDIEKIEVNGEIYELKSQPYTTSDDGKCTRVNLYNAWVSDVPSEARTTDGDASDAAAILLDNDDLSNLKTISITFKYTAP